MKVSFSRVCTRISRKLCFSRYCAFLSAWLEKSKNGSNDDSPSTLKKKRKNGCQSENKTAKYLGWNHLWSTQGCFKHIQATAVILQKHKSFTLRQYHLTAAMNIMNAMDELYHYEYHYFHLSLWSIIRSQPLKKRGKCNKTFLHQQKAHWHNNNVPLTLRWSTRMNSI